MISSCITALPTPFKESKEIDFCALKSLLKRQMNSGINTFVVGGSTGESLLLSFDEYRSVIQACIEFHVNIKIVAGISGISTKEMISKSIMAESLGCTALLISSPLYVKPNEESIVKHFQDIHDSVSLPIILYNVPGRVGYDIHNVIHKLSSLERCIGIKDASLKFERIYSYKKIKKDFLYFTGDDVFIYATLSSRGHGCISVVSNIIPEKILDMTRFIKNNMFSDALKIHEQSQDLIDVLFIDSNPIPLKYALHHMGYIQNVLREPLLPLKSPLFKRSIVNALKGI